MPPRPTLTDALTRHLDHVTRKRGHLGAPQLLLQLPGRQFSYGDRQRPFHVASIGKVATTVLAMQLIDDLDARVATLVAPELLAGLFVVDGVDHATAVTVRQLLDHTSGIADYFDGPTTSGPPLRELLVTQPDRFWTPSDLLDFSRHGQRATAAPGKRFAYSDTGYVLLGVLLETVSGRAFHELLHERIFDALGMSDSYLMLRSQPTTERAIAPAWLDGVDVSGYRSLSADWAGGGIVSTLDDLARFSVALHGGELVTENQLAEMKRVRHRFRPGIHYGTGFMSLRFAEFFFLLRKLPQPTGHIGVLATHMFYDETNDAHIIMNFGSTAEMVRSFRTLIQIESLLRRQSQLTASANPPRRA